MIKYFVLLICAANMAFAQQEADEDFDFTAAQSENVESLDYRSFVGSLEWRVGQVKYDLEQRCDEDGNCTLVSFEEKTKGWTANLTIGNGPGSGASYYGGSSGTINVINGATFEDNVIANFGIGYRNITCERSAIVDKGFEEAHLVLMRSMITDNYTIREDLELGQIMMLRAFASVVGVLKGGGCNNQGYHGRY